MSSAMSSANGNPAVAQADEAERTLIGAILVNPDHLPVVASMLSAADFRLPFHRAVFAAIVELDAEGSAIDLVTIRHRFIAAGSEYATEGVKLAALIDGIPRASNAEAYAGIVLEASTLRRVALAAEQVIQACQSGDDADTVLSRAQAIMLAIGQGRRRGKGLEPLRVALRETQASLEAAITGATVGALSYGLPDLDQITGGIHNGDLVVIGARPSMGKSALAFQIARTIARNAAVKSGPIAIFSVEMARAQVAQRMLSAEGMVDMAGFRGGALRQCDLEALERAMGEALKWPIWIDDAGTISVVEIAARARRLQADQGLALVIVDYLQLVRGAGRAENRTAEVGAISRGLKTLAKDLAVPASALAQRNRSADETRPILSHLRESGDIEADADAVLLLWRPDAKDESGVEIIVAKQRNGPKGAIQTYFRAEYQRFESAAKEELYP